MANNKNLIKNEDLTPDERRKNARKAGIKSGEKRRERKKLKELLEIALQLQNEETGERNDIAITAAIINKARKGDVYAYLTIRDTLGEKPVEKQEVAINPVTIKDDINE